MNVDIDAFTQLIDSVRFLYAHGNWEQAQTHQSLISYAIEEAYELQEAILSADRIEIISELGDLLLQVIFHAVIAEHAAEFTLDDITRTLNQKLHIRSAPIFAGTILTAAEQDAYWQAQKPLRLAQVDQIFAALKWAGSPWQRATRVMRYLESLRFPLNRLPHKIRYPDLLAEEESVYQENLDRFMQKITLLVKKYGSIPQSEQEWVDILTPSFEQTK